MAGWARLAFYLKASARKCPANRISKKRRPVAIGSCLVSEGQYIIEQLFDFSVVERVAVDYGGFFQ